MAYAFDSPFKTHLEGQDSLIPTTSSHVRWVQSSLNRAIGAGLIVDGIMGPRTRAAIRRFQQRQGLRPDGIVGPQTHGALLAHGVRPPSRATAPAPPVSSAQAPSGGRSRGCPEPARLAVDRCLNPGSEGCPAIAELLCVKEIDGIPFEYPTRVARDPAAGLYLVSQRRPSVTQRFIPSVRNALRAFIKNVSGFGMPIEAILTAGSLYCRCVTGTNTLSNHSFGDAIDVVGVRWPPFGGPRTILRETTVHNYLDPGERVLLRRLNACLRLSFATVIDYHRRDHRDHFHCDMNRGAGRILRGRSTLMFVQEALSAVLGRSIRPSGQLDVATREALIDFAGLGPELFTDSRLLNAALDRLFAHVASGR